MAAALSHSPAGYVRALAGLAGANAPGFPAPAATGPRLVDRDQLIIDPANPRDWRAKRVIDLGC